MYEAKSCISQQYLLCFYAAVYLLTLETLLTGLSGINNFWNTKQQQGKRKTYIHYSLFSLGIQEPFVPANEVGVNMSDGV